MYLHSLNAPSSIFVIPTDTVTLSMPQQPENAFAAIVGTYFPSIMQGTTRSPVAGETDLIFQTPPSSA